MVNGGKETSQVAVFLVASFLRQGLLNRTIRLDELGDRLLFNGSVPQEPGSLRSFSARVNEHEHLVLARPIEDLHVADFIGGSTTYRFLLRDTDKLLLQTARPIRRVEGEKALRLIKPPKALIWAM